MFCKIVSSHNYTYVIIDISPSILYDNMICKHFKIEFVLKIHGMVVYLRMFKTTFILKTTFYNIVHKLYQNIFQIYLFILLTEKLKQP